MRNRGFTLTELLVVVAVIAILAVIAVPNFLDAQVRARVARARAEMQTVATALELYTIDNNAYPPMLGSPDDGTGQPQNSLNGYGNTRLNAWRGIPHQLTTPLAYLTLVPPDPFKLGAVATQTDDESTPDVGRPFESGNPFDPSYVYHNIKQYWEAAEPGKGFYGADLSRYGHWRVYSFGPNRQFNAVATLDLTGLARYDPTNGILSYGEVYRTSRGEVE